MPNRPSACREPEISSPGRDPSHVSLHELIMMLLADTINPNLIQLGAAMPNPSSCRTRRSTASLRNLARQNDPNSHQYRFPPGLNSLRTQVAQRAVTWGCSLSPKRHRDHVGRDGGDRRLPACGLPARGYRGG